ncbi:histidine kinase dimerization/phospho-acceptor domain-containing protein, partial [Salmonella enterica]|uniref:histidine kinase dimerization/phospho-acceptor domain-containing protein n=2 Tax=Pseudomonadota TaxID=1224 RepID=UPI0026650637
EHRSADLMKEVAARERAQEQLRHAQKMEAIGQLTGGVAHDFNNLLMAVMGNLDLLRKRVPEDPRLQRLIDGALQGAERGASLTQRLLAF